MLTPADDVHHINKHNFKVPFVCGCRDLGEALRRIAEGAAMIRTKVAPVSAYIHFEWAALGIAVFSALAEWSCAMPCSWPLLWKPGLLWKPVLGVEQCKAQAMLICTHHVEAAGGAQGEAGTGNVVEAVRHCRAVQGAIRALQTMDDDEVYVFAKELRAPVELVRQARPGWGLAHCNERCWALPS